MIRAKHCSPKNQTLALLLGDADLSVRVLARHSTSCYNQSRSDFMKSNDLSLDSDSDFIGESEKLTPLNHRTHRLISRRFI